MPAVVAPLIKSQFHLSDTQIGALLGPAFSTLYAAGLLVAGHLIAGRNPYRVAALCTVAWTVGGVVFALATSYAGLVAGRVALGLGQAAFAPAALMLLSCQGDRERRSRSLSTFTTGSAVGRSAALLIGGGALAMMAGQGLNGLEPWQTASLALVAPNLILIALLWRASLNVVPPTGDPRQGMGAAFRLIRGHANGLAGVMAAGAFAVLAVQAAGAWAASILNRGFDLAPADAALAAGVVVLVFAPVGHLGAGWMLGSGRGRRLGAGLMMIAGMAVAVTGGLILAMADTTAAALVGLAALTAGAGAAAVVSLIEVQSLTEMGLRAQVGAIFLALISFVGVGMGPLLTGMVSDLGVSGAGGLAWSLAAVTAAAAAGVTVLAVVFGERWRQFGALDVPARTSDAEA